MIQRKQTIYLFCAGLITLMLLFIPFGNLSTGLAYYNYSAFDVREATPDNTFILSTIGNALLLITTTALSFITIFLYKNRKLQLKLLSVNMLVVLVTIFTITYIYPSFIFARNIYLAGAKLDFNYVIIISFVSAIGLYLAKKAVSKDEAVVKNADRLR
jgi:cation transport ATPase